uniref:EF-hand domain-containing protein n=1 Tax=Percolomonas cosmopolitus TaxID=63605 RepID=A0A7S1KSY1_9EUKA|mmetsp:Transcript_7377/g.27563  ORF Transcript_7377/g.27563 Transcript_7377/m.27563 type:complete len:546 (+) Transcript_7377:87-1724(+)
MHNHDNRTTPNIANALSHQQNTNFDFRDDERPSVKPTSHKDARFIENPTISRSDSLGIMRTNTAGGGSGLNTGNTFQRDASGGGLREFSSGTPSLANGKKMRTSNITATTTSPGTGRKPMPASASKESLLRRAVLTNWTTSPTTMAQQVGGASPDAAPRTEDLSSIGTPALGRSPATPGRDNQPNEGILSMLQKGFHNHFKMSSQNVGEEPSRHLSGGRKDSMTTFNTHLSYDSPSHPLRTPHSKLHKNGLDHNTEAHNRTGPHGISSIRNNQQDTLPSSESSLKHIARVHLPSNLSANIFEGDDAPSVDIQNLFFNLSNNEMYLKISTLEEKMIEFGDFNSTLERKALSEWVSSAHDFKSMKQTEPREDMTPEELERFKKANEYIDVYEFNLLMTHGSLVRSTREEMLEAFRLFDVTDMEEIPLDLLKDIYSSWGKFSIGEDATYVMESFVTNEQEALLMEEEARRREEKKKHRQKKKKHLANVVDPRKIDYREMIEELVDATPYEDKVVFRDQNAIINDSTSIHPSLTSKSQSRHSLSMRSLA